jgi:hypothetical protein
VAYTYNSSYSVSRDKEGISSFEKVGKGKLARQDLISTNKPDKVAQSRDLSYLRGR